MGFHRPLMIGVFRSHTFSKKGYDTEPVGMQAYKGKAMANDIVEILKHEKIEQVIGIGHDWGSFLLSRLANFHPSLFSKLVFLDIGYSVPGHGLSRTTVNYINNAILKNMGYSVFGYFLFFEDDDAAKLLDENPESVESLFFSRDEDLGKKYMGAVGGFRTWLTDGKTAPSPAFVSSQDKTCFRDLFSAQNGGFSAPINWYKVSLNDLNKEDESEIPEANYILQQPTLLISSSNFITATADFPNQMKSLVPNLVCEKLDCGHWVMLEKTDETNELMAAFLT
ncbi:Cytosolic epoxide hydrolase 2 [Hyphodiscus hymeniophilus]|uniref:Cytosolic epoxide hydrolase 2 n=1 Tax=Hyphodiscus hymeniophilus TaxID=353542 RepID=A0A9P6VKF1_9HELO|nr:Cytosolic epoxide hydrolase 2 [Hyphodiscus hymeniophilus]